MDTPVLDWLSRIGTFAVVFAVCGFVVLNGIAALVFVRTRDRDLVNRWTGRILAGNLLLLGTGLGVPLVTAAARLAVTTFSSSVAPTFTPKSSELQQIPADASPPR